MVLSLSAIPGGQARARPRGRATIAEILLQNEWVDEAALDVALADRPRSDAALGRALVLQGATSSAHVAAAQAQHWGLGTADLAQSPPVAAAYDAQALDIYLKFRVVPWQTIGKMTVYAIADPALAAQALAVLNPPMGLAFFAVAPPEQVDQALLDLGGATLAERAANRVPAEYSVRALGPARRAALMTLLIVFALALTASDSILVLLGIVLILLNVLTTLTRIAALLASTPFEQTAPDQSDAVVLANHRALARVSILIPLYREAAMVPKLVKALTELDYPAALLDIKLLLEVSDEETCEAVRQADLPPWITPLVLPDGQPRTKPRAMNLALDFCDGEIIGVLDAEDRPAPDQLRLVAEHLRNAPPETACVQCQLSWFNARENWITRCFQIEYSIWFDVLLHGFRRLGLPIPLGGTSVYFRRSALMDLHGWDAHNVTEDADLGIRLARRGMTCAVLTSVTAEEANLQVIAWIRQRSRWLKGYMLTWLTHMQRPVQLWRELGPAGFLGFNVLFLGGAMTYLTFPLFWTALAMTIATGQSVFGNLLTGSELIALSVILGVGQVVMLASAALALKRRRALDLLPWIALLLPYWTFGAVAAWKAVIELAWAPFYWDKTRHGVSQQEP